MLCYYLDFERVGGFHSLQVEHSEIPATGALKGEAIVNLLRVLFNAADETLRLVQDLGINFYWR